MDALAPLVILACGTIDHPSFNVTAPVQVDHDVCQGKVGKVTEVTHLRFTRVLAQSTASHMLLST